MSHIFWSHPPWCPTNAYPTDDSHLHTSHSCITDVSIFLVSYSPSPLMSHKCLSHWWLTSAYLTFLYYWCLNFSGLIFPIPTDVPQMPIPLMTHLCIPHILVLLMSQFFWSHIPHPHWCPTNAYPTDDSPLHTSHSCITDVSIFLVSYSPSPLMSHKCLFYWWLTSAHLTFTCITDVSNFPLPHLTFPLISHFCISHWCLPFAYIKFAYITDVSDFTVLHSSFPLMSHMCLSYRCLPVACITDVQHLPISDDTFVYPIDISHLIVPLMSHNCMYYWYFTVAYLTDDSYLPVPLVSYIFIFHWCLIFAYSVDVSHILLPLMSHIFLSHCLLTLLFPTNASHFLIQQKSYICLSNWCCTFVWITVASHTHWPSQLGLQNTLTVSLQRGKIPSTSVLDMTDGDTSVILELWGMWSTPSLPLLPGPFWLRVVLFTNPSTRAGYDTRSIFKRSLTGLNSEFFLLLD